MTESTPSGAAGQPSPPPVLENLFGPEVYADMAAYFALKNGVVSIQFVSTRFDADDAGKVKLVTVGRLVMPLSGAQGLAIGLYDYLAKNGLAPDMNPQRESKN